MNKRIRFTIGIGLTVLLLAAVFATAAFAQGPMGGGFGGMMGGQGQSGFGGMMGRYDGATGGFGGLMKGFRGMMQGWLTGQTTTGITGTTPFGPGMMGGQGFGGMMGGFGGMMAGQGFGGMMGSSGVFTGTMPANCPMFGGATIPANAQPITFDKAVEAVQGYVTSYNNADPSAGPGQVLALAEVMEFENNFYAIIAEKSTGKGAFELLVNRYTGAVTPEPGPNMMWNTKYGHVAGFGGMMGGMMGRRMGGAWNQQTGPLTVTVEQARTAAQQWLDANQPGARLADDEMQFYGYYTMDFLKDGKVAGMLSVNGYTGQVWYHNWHGAFISEQTF